MTQAPANFVKCAPALTVATAMVVAGCYPFPKKTPPAEPTTVIREALPPSSPPPSGLPMSSEAMAEPAEPYVDLEMVNAPVALVLQRLAEIGGLQLVIPGNLNRSVSVIYVHVPVSIALADVLRRSGLRLGPGPFTNLPFDTVTVFYKLPANVDSMSADAIVRRFGVSRAMAELIIASRRP